MSKHQYPRWKEVSVSVLQALKQQGLSFAKLKWRSTHTTLIDRREIRALDFSGSLKLSLQHNDQSPTTSNSDTAELVCLYEELPTNSQIQTVLSHYQGIPSMNTAYKGNHYHSYISYQQTVALRNMYSCFSNG